MGVAESCKYLSTIHCFSGLNAGKYGQENTPYLDTFHAVIINPSLNAAFQFDKAYEHNSTKLGLLRKL